MKNIIYVLSCIILILAISYKSYGQSNPTWQRAYRDLSINSHKCYGYTSCQLNDGSFLIIGVTPSGYTPENIFFNRNIMRFNNYYSKGSVPWSSYIIKVNAYGDIIDTTHVYRYLGYTCAKTLDDGCIIMGYIDTTGPNYDRMHATKLNSAGKVVWQRRYDNTFIADCLKMIRTSDNKFVGCGDINNLDSYIIKIDSNGNRLWQRSFTKGFCNQYVSLCETSDGKYLVVGDYYLNETSPTIGYISKFDTSGYLISEREYLFNNNSFIIRAINKMGNKYLLSGDTGDTLTQKSISAFMIINESGDILAHKSLPGFSEYGVVNTDCQVINDNKFLILDQKFRSTSSTYDNAYVRLIDSSGNILKTQMYGNVEVDLRKVNKISNGQFMFVGISAHYNEWISDIFVVRADSDLYATPCKIENNITQIAEKYLILDAFPNPFNSSIKISYNIPQRDFYRMDIYNILGQKVRNIINENLNIGSYTKIIDFTDMPSGMYFIQLSSGKSQITKKIALIK